MGPPLFSMSLHLAAFIAILSASLIPDIEGARNSAGSQQQQTPADFDCPEEFGYYAHPTDCTLYYVCVFGGALLESCTGGLMYSHELQTCDWPRNVGCAPGQQQQISQPQQQHITQKISQQPVSQQVDTTSTSRGRQRQQQIQIPKADLYTEEEDLGPAEEIESDRQQRVYRGQPSTLGQVASDRDGLNTHSNAIPVQSTGGRDKLSVVSYGAQQQYNSKNNKRRQTDGSDKSDHNFLTNISRVRKKRDNSNSNRRSVGVTTKRRKAKGGGRQRKEDERKRRSSKEVGNSLILMDGKVKPTNAMERSNRIEKRNGDYESSEDKSSNGKESSNGNNRSGEPISEENENYDNEEEGDEDAEEEEEDSEESDEDEDEDNEESEELNLNEDSSEKNSSVSEEFKMDFPSPPESWESFDDFKFPFDEMDFDFDKFLEDLKSDKFDGFDLYGKENGGGTTSTTVYPTSIFNFGSTTFAPFLETSTVPSAVKLDFFFPNFLNKNKNTLENNSEPGNRYENNNHPIQSKASPRADNGEQNRAFENTTVLPMQQGMYLVSVRPESTVEQNDIGNFRNLDVAEDRVGNVENHSQRRNQFSNGNEYEFQPRPFYPRQMKNSSNTHHNRGNAQKNPNPISNRGNHQWERSQHNGDKIQQINSRGNIKFTLSALPTAAVTTTQRYINKDTNKHVNNDDLASINLLRTTEPSGVIQETPRNIIESTKPSMLSGNQDYRYVYSTLYDSSLESPTNNARGKHDHITFTTSEPMISNTQGSLVKKSSESSLENLSPTSSSVLNNNQHIVSYSYPSVTFRESRGPGTFNNLVQEQYRSNQPQQNNRYYRGNNRHTAVNPQNKQRPRNYVRSKNNNPTSNNNRPPNMLIYRKQSFQPQQRRGGNNLSKQRYHQNNRPSERINVRNFPNKFAYENEQLQENKKHLSVEKSQISQSNKRSNHPGRDSRNQVKKSNINNYESGENSRNIVRSKDEIIRPHKKETVYQGIGYTYPITNPTTSYAPNSNVFINTKLHSFSYVNVHENQNSSTTAASQNTQPTVAYPNHTPDITDPFRTSIVWSTALYESPTEEVKTDKLNVTTLNDEANHKVNVEGPAGSYVFFKSNAGSTTTVPVDKNNLYKNHKLVPDDNYNDYYNEYDEDYDDEGNSTLSAPRPPPVPKTLQNIDYRDEYDQDYDDYNDDDDGEYEDDSYDDNRSKHNDKRENNSMSQADDYYDDEEDSDAEEEEEEEPRREQNVVERPQTASASSTTTKIVECIPTTLTTEQLEQGKLPCHAQQPTDRPTTTADEQKNSEQTRRTITLLRASVQPVQQQVYDTRGYNTTRYIQQQQQQYDPNYYTVYDEEAEQYKDIADYSQYIQQNKQDIYARKKPSVEIVQQEPIQRGSPYTKNKYSNQQENIYQSVTPQEYDSYSIQTNDDIPYRQVQTKSNNRGNLRHRGSLTYTVSPNEAEPPALPRGTPPPQRGRPTLKPSTTVVGKAAEFVDIYRYPARRPDNVYPTPQVDKTAAKCRKDVCLLPDCYCGGKDIPGDLSPEETPQIVLLTFDDSVNDLNKGLYSDLFDKGRVNPNGCPIGATFYVSHEWTDYSQVQNLYAGGHEIASHSVSHSFGEQFSQKKWTREIAGQREILAAYGGVKLEDIRGMRAPFLAVGGNKMFKMLYDSNFTYDSSMPVYENRPPSWPYTLDYKVFHDCMIPPCPTKSYPGVWEVPMVMWQDLNGGRCSMGDACSNPPTSDGVYKMLIKNFERHFTTNRAPFGLFYHAAWFTQPHHKEGFIAFLDTINKMPEVWLITNWQAVQWVRDPTPLSRLGNFQPFQCNYPDRPKKCNNPKVCNLWHKSGVRYMRTCQACPDIYPWTGKSGVRNSRVDNDLE